MNNIKENHITDNTNNRFCIMKPITIPGDNHANLCNPHEDITISGDNVSGYIKNIKRDIIVEKDNYGILNNNLGTNTVRKNLYKMINKKGINSANENEGEMYNISGPNYAKKNTGSIYDRYGITEVDENQGTISSVSGPINIENIHLSTRVVGGEQEKSIKDRLQESIRSLVTILQPSKAPKGKIEKIQFINTPDFTIFINTGTHQARKYTDNDEDAELLKHFEEQETKYSVEKSIQSIDAIGLYYDLGNGYTLTHTQESDARQLRYKDQLITINQKGYSVVYQANPTTDEQKESL